MVQSITAYQDEQESRKVAEINARRIKAHMTELFAIMDKASPIEAAQTLGALDSMIQVCIKALDR